MPRRVIDGTPNITQVYGERSNIYAKGYHTGVDYAVAPDTPIIAPADCSVIEVGDGRAPSDGRGFYIILKSADNVTHHIYHLNRWHVSGGTVTEGQHIADSGNTGLSTGPHVHYETRRGGLDFNPADWLGVTDTPSNTLMPYQRQVAQYGVNERDKPSTSAPILREFQPGELLDFKGYVKGATVNGNNTWFVGRYAGKYFHSGSFTDTSTHDLPDITNPATPTPVPTPPGGTTGDPGVTDLTAADFPEWIQFNVVTDPDRSETANQEAYDYYKERYGQDYRYYPIEHIAHWWGPKGAYNHDSVVQHILNTPDLSVGFVTSANRITMFEHPLTRVSYTTGARNMYSWSTENDPLLTEDGYKTLGFLVYAVEKKNPRLKGEAIRLHKEFMPTACSDIDIIKVRAYANKFDLGELDPATGQPPVDPPPTNDPAIPEDKKAAMISILTSIAALVAALVALIQG